MPPVVSNEIEKMLAEAEADLCADNCAGYKRLLELKERENDELRAILDRIFKLALEGKGV